MYGHLLGFYPRTQKLEQIALNSVLLNNVTRQVHVPVRSFLLNGHTLRFYPQTKTLEPPCTA